MGTGFRGTFVISWSQTEVDGLEAAPLHALNVGAAWSWRGDAVRVDGPNGLLRLDEADGEGQLRRRAARMVRRLVGAAVTHKTRLDEVDVQDPMMESGFVVTDGAQTYSVTLIEVAPGSRPLLMFIDQLPPRNTDLWVVSHSIGQSVKTDTETDTGRGGVICFTPGTWISTPDGPRRVEELGEGDKVQTKDDGAQEILWTGRRRMSGARLFAMPYLRPIRIRTGALGIDRPDREFLVSPEHRMLIAGDVARALFNTHEVLVAARDLVNGRTITVDHALKEVTYVHVLLPRHQVIWANGVETESFHPANTALDTLAPDDRSRLLQQFALLEEDPHTYGSHARRNLSRSEAAILAHDAA